MPTTAKTGYKFGPPPEAYPGESRYQRMSEPLGGDTLYSREYLRRFYPGIDEGYNPYADPSDIHYNPIFDPASPYYNEAAANAWQAGQPVNRRGAFVTQAGAVEAPRQYEPPSSQRYSAWNQQQQTRNIAAAKRRWGPVGHETAPPKPPPATWQNDKIRPGFYSPTGRYMGIGRRAGAPPQEQVRSQITAAQERMRPPQPAIPASARGGM